jgi:serine protease Do
MSAKLIVPVVFALIVALSAAPIMAQEKSELEDLQDKTIELLKQVQKATVAIRCKVEGKKPAKPTVPLRGLRRRQQRSGQYFGTGTVISPDGYILTSTSVVPSKGKEIKVYYRDGKVYDAELVGCEEKNNVTLIKIKASNLPVLKLGSSKNLKAGQLAFTLGNPYSSITKDRQVAFSMGVVSGIYRLRGDGDYTGKVIETDAALNNGNDGGPLVNVRGEIIGILNLSYSYTKWLNVAVPIDQIKLILEDLKEGSEIYPRYGFTLAEEAEYDGGVEVVGVHRRGPARKAGIRRGDLILEIDGIEVERADHLEVELSKLPPGTEITFLIRRGEEERVVKLVSGKFVEKRRKPKPKPEPKKPEIKEPGTMGITATEDDAGLIISKVVHGGAADEAGVELDDKLLEVNGKKVATIKDVIAVMKDMYAGSVLTLLVERKGEIKKIELTLKKKK